MVVRMRHTRAHTGNRRSHHALVETKLQTCPNCEARIITHVACKECGMYKGRVVRKVKAKKA